MQVAVVVAPGVGAERQQSACEHVQALTNAEVLDETEMQRQHCTVWVLLPDAGRKVRTAAGRRESDHDRNVAVAEAQDQKRKN